MSRLVTLGLGLILSGCVHVERVERSQGASLAEQESMICGPRGVSGESPPVPLARGTLCRRWGWDGLRYRDFCEGGREWPARDDPWLQPYVLDGSSTEEAQVSLSDARTNGCGR